ncbi:MAG TPA: hypothetical protein PLB63_06525 [Planctomycetota bacterium]|nr:hypothetical protein [Planctomycetota bacterium]
MDGTEMNCPQTPILNGFEPLEQPDKKSMNKNNESEWRAHLKQPFCFVASNE